MKEVKHKPCPSCGSTNLFYQKHISYGHGDSSFEGWIECECGLRNAFVNNWGSGGYEDEHKAWNKWDKTKREFNIEDYETEEETAKRKEFEKFASRYDGMNIFEFLKSFEL
jgi:hypothetical protein